MAVGTRVRIPFLYDVIQHVRFLVVLPIAILAESYISPRFTSVLNRFLRARIVSDEDVQRFMQAISRATAIKNSVLAEVLIVALAYLYMLFRLERSLPAELTTWNNPGSAMAASSAPVEFWYLWVSMPLFTFFWIRWIWRQGVWASLLFKISRLDLRVTSTHGDHAGGLAFVAVGQRRFALLVFAIGSVISASIGEEVLFAGASVSAFESEVVALFLICIAIVMGPLMPFTAPLIRAKLRDFGTYWTLSSEYAQDFDDKWIAAKGRRRGLILGSADVQSLSDMKNSYEGISDMRTILPDRRSISVLLIAYLLPLVPLIATVMPLRQIVIQLFKLLVG